MEIFMNSLDNLTDDILIERKLYEALYFRGAHSDMNHYVVAAEFRERPPLEICCGEIQSQEAKRGGK
jgi:hypothetical protein